MADFMTRMRQDELRRRRSRNYNERMKNPEFRKRQAAATKVRLQATLVVVLADATTWTMPRRLRVGCWLVSMRRLTPTTAAAALRAPGEQDRRPDATKRADYLLRTNSDSNNFSSTPRSSREERDRACTPRVSARVSSRRDGLPRRVAPRAVRTRHAPSAAHSPNQPTDHPAENADGDRDAGEVAEAAPGAEALQSASGSAGAVGPMGRASYCRPSSPPCQRHLHHHRPHPCTASPSRLPMVTYGTAQGEEAERDMAEGQGVGAARGWIRFLGRGHGASEGGFRSGLAARLLAVTAPHKGSRAPAMGALYTFMHI